MRAQPLTWRRLTGPAALVAVAVAVAAGIAETLGARVVGWMAAGPTVTLVVWLAVLLLGAAVLDTAGRVVFATVVSRAEGRLRADLLEAALAQPLSRLDDQAVGELIDRVDDDSRQLGSMLRRIGWETGRAALRSVLAWIVAGLVFWPAWIAFPLVAAAVVAVARPLTPAVARCKTAEEMAWSDHSAQLEEAIAGQDDVRTALGQAYVVRGFARRAAAVLARTRDTCVASSRVGLRTGFVAHLLLVVVALGGVWWVRDDPAAVGGLVTLWILATAFVSQVDAIVDRMPEIQAGLGAVARVSALLGTEREPDGGRPAPSGPADVRLRELTAGYGDGFRLAGIDLTVPAGTTCALVGRTGSGKSTLVKVLSRAVEPDRGQVFLGGRDVRDVALDELRRAVGVVTQRTEILSATLAENITLFDPAVPRADVEAALEALDLREWVDGLPARADTRLGSGGLTLSAGEEQLVAFARLLVRDVAVVVLDEATARMDPATESRVTRASQALLAGRTGIIVAHRLSTVRRADSVALLEDGRLVQHGDQLRLAREPGRYADLLAATGDRDTVPVATVPADTGPADTGPADTEPADTEPADTGHPAGALRRSTRRDAPPVRDHTATPPLWRVVARLLVAHPGWGVVGGAMFLIVTLGAASGTVVGWLWGLLVQDLSAGGSPWPAAAALAVVLLLFPVWIAVAFRRHPLWWSAITLRVRLAVLRGQTMQHRTARTPAGEIVARALDSDRLVLYADRWLDVAIAVGVAISVGVASGDAGTALVIGAFLLLCAAAATAGAPLAGRAGRAAADARGRFGTALGSALDAARTVKLAAATGAVRAHLHRVDGVRVRATIFEQRIRGLLEGVPGVLLQGAVVLTWSLHLTGTWDLATALLVSTTLSGAGHLGQVCAAVVIEAPIARRWVRTVAAFAGPAPLHRLPAGVDLAAGSAPEPEPVSREPLHRLTLEKVAAVHDDGTVGVEGVDLEVDAGTLVLVTGQVGAGKSSLLASLAGLVGHEGVIRWNGRAVTDPETFLRPGQVAYVAQLPRVLSGTFDDNVTLGHPRPAADALDDARMTRDVAAAGGPGAVVGHRGIRLSGGQVQRLAMARALATRAELVVADDVSSALDVRTELELWSVLRHHGHTVIGASTKRAALARADRVVVLDQGRVADEGPWDDLAPRWSHLAG